jgi:hypothetical protein
LRIKQISDSFNFTDKHTYGLRSLDLDEFVSKKESALTIHQSIPALLATCHNHSLARRRIGSVRYKKIINSLPVRSDKKSRFKSKSRGKKGRKPENL